MNEMNATMVSGEPDMMRNITNGKYAPLAITILGILGAFSVFEYFDKVDKGMKLGYNTSVKSNKYGEIWFTKSSNDIESEKVEISETANNNLANHLPKECK